METKTRFKRRGIKGEGEGFMIMKRGCYLRCKNTLIVGGRRLLMVRKMGRKYIKKTYKSVRLCDGVVKKKKHKNRHATRQVKKKIRRRLHPFPFKFSLRSVSTNIFFYYRHCLLFSAYFRRNQSIPSSYMLYVPLPMH